LHAGYLQGKERIIVTHDGDYGWQDDSSLVISRHFDDKGKLADDHFVTQVTSNGAKTKVTLANSEAAVLEKIPVQFTPSTKVLSQNWKATATVAQYDETQLSLKVNAPEGGIITIVDGLLSLANGKELDVLSKNNNIESSKSVTVNNGKIVVIVPDKFDGMYTIKMAQ
jgi:hypothetical protein